MSISIYCSGSIQKGSSDKGKLCWSDTERSQLAQAASPLRIRFLRPDDPAHDLSNTAALFGRDMYQVQMADFVVVDARERRGIGIGVEMVACKILGTTLIVVLPTNTYYRSRHLTYRGSTVEEYVHPHVDILADVIVDTFEEAGKWIKENSHFATPKGINSIYDAINTYKTDMLSYDAPMLEMIKDLEESDGD